VKRMIRGVAALALTAVLVACGREAPAPPKSEAPDDRVTSGPVTGTVPTIVFLGTSITAGLGLDPTQAYPSLIQQRVDSAGLRFQVINAGVSGETSAGALSRIGWLLKQFPRVLVIETGANDGLRGQRPDAIKANIQAIIDSTRARSPSTRIILAGMQALPNLGGNYVRGFVGIYPALARENQVALIPFILDGVAGVDSLNQPDGIHPTVEGQRIVAENVWKVLEPALKEAS
jgi:acyl-CoA thioesterase I